MWRVALRRGNSSLATDWRKMADDGLTVRCFASTTVEDWQEQEHEHDDQREEESGEMECSDRDEKEQDNLSELGQGQDASIPVRSSAKQAEILPVQEPMEGLDLESAAASSPDSSSDSGDESSSSEANSDSQRGPPETQHASCVQEAQLSPDGSCVFTSDYDRVFNVYPIDSTAPPTESPRSLSPYASWQSANPIWAFAANPFFDFQDANTTHVLISRRDSYITLHNALWDISQTYSDAPKTPINISTPLSFYKNINPLTEAVNAPLSLAYSHSGTHFFAGLQNSIATFDLSHTSSPIHNMPTIPSLRNKLKGGGRGFKGHISALALSPASPTHNDGLLAAGSRTRHIGIYDSTSGSEITSFALAHSQTPDEPLAQATGSGVTSLKWSPCGTYLYVAERCSSALLIYDARRFSLVLGYCAGRKADSKQKLGFDVVGAGLGPSGVGAGVDAASHVVWAGGSDGCVRLWSDPYLKQGPVEADHVVRVSGGGGAGGEELPVVSTLVHPKGSLAVTASGKMRVGDGDGDGECARKGRRAGGGIMPRFREWGRLDILSLA